MYFCMQCQSVHELNVPGIILRTGFQTVKGIQLPVGFCQSSNDVLYRTDLHPSCAGLEMKYKSGQPA